MSYYNDYDYVAASNNSVNDNKLNAKLARRSPVHQLKKILKPLLAMLKKHNNNTYKKNPQPEYFRDDDCSREIDENLANELLENQIFEDIDACEEFAGVQVYHEGHLDIVPVFRGQRYIPVHFAKTEAGTFFWSSMVGADCDINCQGDKNPITYNQQAELQVAAGDRWAQA